MLMEQTRGIRNPTVNGEIRSLCIYFASVFSEVNRVCKKKKHDPAAVAQTFFFGVVMFGWDMSLLSFVIRPPIITL